MSRCPSERDANRVDELIQKSRWAQLSDLERRASLAEQAGHDIRAPLAALMAATANLSCMTEARKTVIAKATSRIQEIADHLLSQSPRLQMQTVFVTEMIESIVQEKNSAFGFHPGNTILLDGAEESRFCRDRFMVFADPSELGRAVSNVIDNAIEALDKPSGVVSIRVSRVEGSCRIAISDNGRGISPQRLATLGRQGVTYGKDSRGYGLGLYQARKAAEQFGGELVITSEEHVGTTVAFILPLALS